MGFGEADPPIVCRVLPTWKAALLMILLPVCLATFIVACIGTYSLTDPKGETALGRTEFARRWRGLLDSNPMSNAMLFNGSMFGLLYCGIQLAKHRKAKQLQATGPLDVRSRQEKRQSARHDKKGN